MLEKGNLKHFKLADLLNIFGQSKKTGQLLIESDDQGHLYFQQGNLVHAEFSLLEGENAFYKLMTIENGDFNFIENITTNKTTITKDTSELIRNGTLTIDLTNLLRLHNLTFNPNSTLTILQGYLEELSKDENDFINKLKAENNISIIAFANKLDFDTSLYISILEYFINKKVLKINKSNEENFWQAFEKTVNKFYNEFTSISGIKMSTDLDKKIQDLISINSLNLTFKDGRIYTNELFNFPIEKQVIVYKVFLGDLVTYFKKVYGEAFIEKVFHTLIEANPEIDDLKKKINI